MALVLRSCQKLRQFGDIGGDPACEQIAAHWMGGPTTSKLYFSAIDRSVSPSAPCRSSNDFSNPPGVTPTNNMPGLVPTFWKVCAAPRGTNITDPGGRARDMVTQLYLKLARHDVEEFILGFVDVRWRPALGCDGLTK